MTPPKPLLNPRLLKKWGIGMLRMLALAAVLLWSIYPIALIVSMSLRAPRDILSHGSLWGVSFTFQNYQNLWKRWPDLDSQPRRRA